MDWIELTVLTTTQGADIVSAQLIEAGSAGTVIEDRNDVKLNQRPEGQWDILDESIALRMSEDVKVTGYYPADERAADAVAGVRARLEALKGMDLGIDFGKLEILSGRVDEEDWAECWKAAFKPFKIGERLAIRPSWTAYDPLPGDLVIELDPGMAFGTGTHETTALCASWLEELVKPGVKVTWAPAPGFSPSRRLYSGPTMCWLPTSIRWRLGSPGRTRRSTTWRVQSAVPRPTCSRASARRRTSWSPTSSPT